MGTDSSRSLTIDLSLSRPFVMTVAADISIKGVVLGVVLKYESTNLEDLIEQFQKLLNTGAIPRKRGRKSKRGAAIQVA